MGALKKSRDHIVSTKKKVVGKTDAHVHVCTHTHTHLSPYRYSRYKPTLDCSGFGAAALSHPDLGSMLSTSSSCSFQIIAPGLSSTVSSLESVSLLSWSPIVPGAMH